ncbi:hypothetical protein ABVV53_08660 [Novosphingobium sp. RD2P27]|uniref:Uncharacterized protein n=1 Tax=Novosphingobium kalidii TaxID=3230299 RepID=A0ABV2D2I5_9SPHN
MAIKVGGGSLATPPLSVYPEAAGVAGQIVIELPAAHRLGFVNMGIQRRICEHCGSEDIANDDRAGWNVETQTWQLTGLFDYAHYHACAGETALFLEKVPPTVARDALT